MSYRVELPVFSGPMDLLLHLVKQHEVDVHEISISRILDDFLAHLKILEQLDLQDLGDFIVMSSTLMEIKSRELLPNEAVEVEEELDPRDDLIRRLLEYKRYRDLARQLETKSDIRSRKSPLVISKPAALRDKDEEDLLDLGEVGIWDLTSAFAKLLEEIGQQDTMEIEVEKRDVGFFMARMLEKFREKRERTFSDVFDRSGGRYGMIGTLIALLEMMKQGYLRAVQEECFDEITLAFIGDPDVEPEQIMAGERLDDQDGQPASTSAASSASPEAERNDSASG